MRKEIRLYTTIQTPTDYMIDDALTKPKAPYDYASYEANRLGVYEWLISRTFILNSETLP